MEPPKFLFAPDEQTEQLYIIHTIFPLSVIWIKQTVPVQLFVVESEIDMEELEADPDEEAQESLEVMLSEAGDFWKRKVEAGLDLN